MDHQNIIPLEQIRIASPCAADWDAMTGDDRVRFCHTCHKQVHNLSALTRREAEDLLHARQGQLCVQFYRRADGTVLTADCPVGAASRSVSLLRRAAAAAAACLTALALLPGAAPFQGYAHEGPGGRRPLAALAARLQQYARAAEAPAAVRGEPAPIMGRPAPPPRPTPRPAK